MPTDDAPKIGSSPKKMLNEHKIVEHIKIR